MKERGRGRWEGAEREVGGRNVREMDGRKEEGDGGRECA